MQALIAALRADVEGREERVRALTEDNASLLGRVSELRQRCHAAEALCGSLVADRAGASPGFSVGSSGPTTTGATATASDGVGALREELLHALRGMVEDAVRCQGPPPTSQEEAPSSQDVGTEGAARECVCLNVCWLHGTTSPSMSSACVTVCPSPSPPLRLTRATDRALSIVCVHGCSPRGPAQGCGGCPRGRGGCHAGGCGRGVVLWNAARAAPAGPSAGEPGGAGLRRVPRCHFPYPITTYLPSW
jgi:hypothetical protein